MTCFLSVHLPFFLLASILPSLFDKNNQGGASPLGAMVPPRVPPIHLAMNGEVLGGQAVLVASGG